MTSLVIIVGIWLVVGVPVVVRHLTDRREAEATAFLRSLEAVGTSQRQVTALPSQTQRRRAVSTALTASGSLTLVAGLLAGGVALMAFGVVAVNLAVLHRGAALQLQGRRPAPAVTPVVPRPAAPRWEGMFDEPWHRLDDPSVDTGAWAA